MSGAVCTREGLWLEDAQGGPGRCSVQSGGAGPPLCQPTQRRGKGMRNPHLKQKTRERA